MPQFQYIGRHRTGRKKTGKIVSKSKQEATVTLKQKGIRVIDITEIPLNAFNKEISFGQSVKLYDFVIYLRQFSTLLKAGVTLVDATRILANQTESKILQKALTEIEKELRGGNPLSYAASLHKKIFPPMFINLVRAGEASGSLEETLDRLAVYFEKQHKTKQKINSALAYPIVLSILAIGVISFLLIAVVPTFVTMFEDFKAELPAITVFVLSASNFFQGYWWLLTGLAALFIFVLGMLYKNKETRYYLDYALLRMPVFGPIFQKSAISRLTRTLSSLFTSSVPILQAIGIVENVVDNEVLRRVLRKSRDSLERGESIAVPMEGHWAFPPLITHMIFIGEETGALDLMLSKVADFYESEVEAATERLKSLIEPLMIVLLAAIVGTIVLAILVPMFEIYNQVE